MVLFNTRSVVLVFGTQLFIVQLQRKGSSDGQWKRLPVTMVMKTFVNYCVLVVNGRITGISILFSRSLLVE